MSNLLQAQAKARRIRDAWRIVFGEPGRRTPAQVEALKDLKARGYIMRTSFVPGANGELCPLKAAATDGRRGLALEILSMVEGDQDEPQQPTEEQKQ